MNLQSLARPEILKLRPYESARGRAAADGVLLNANEAPAPLLEDDLWAQWSMHRYPAPQPAALRDRLCELYGVEENQLLITRGSDEGIDLLVRVFCRPGEDHILETIPCFGMYRIAAGIQNASVVQVERNSETLTIREDVLLTTAQESDRLKLVFLTSPNNPTGDLIDADFLLAMLDAMAGKGLVILDEAYIEFCAADSAASLVQRFPHLVVLRTLSKAWAAAGLRCGAVIANPAVIELLGRVMAPYPLTAPAIAAAMAVTDPEIRERQSVMLKELRREKSRLVSWLAATTWVTDIWPGEANFVLIRVPDGPALVAHCASLGVRIRDFSDQPLLAHCVRLTVGSAEDMLALYRALENYGTSS